MIDKKDKIYLSNNIEKRTFYLTIFGVVLSFVLFLFLIFNVYNPFNFKKIDVQPKSMNTMLEYNPDISLLFAGDVMLSRAINLSINKYGKFDSVEDIRHFTQKSDFFIVNLETSVSNDYELPTDLVSPVFRCKPEKLEILQYADVDIVNLANNHMKDNGVQNIPTTIDHVKGYDLLYYGAGENIEEACNAVIVEKYGIKIGILGYNDSDVVPASSFATENQPGTCKMDIERLQYDIEKLQPQVNYVIVTMHSGTEYVHKSNKRQQDFARSAIDFGANIVIGHHPHTVQEVEKYNDKYIVYSLGNFIFDQPWEYTKQQLILDLRLDTQCLKEKKDNCENLVFIPTYSDRYAKPEIVENMKLKQTILNHLQFENLHKTDCLYLDEGNWQLTKLASYKPLNHNLINDNRFISLFKTNFEYKDGVLKYNDKSVSNIQNLKFDKDYFVLQLDKVIQILDLEDKMIKTINVSNFDILDFDVGNIKGRDEKAYILTDASVYEIDHDIKEIYKLDEETTYSNIYVYQDHYICLW